MYKAKKPCNFAGKSYKIDEPIEAGAVLPTAAPRLIKMGLIAAVDESSVAAMEPAPVSNEGGPLLPPSSTIETAKTYSKAGLARMTRDEVASIAKKMGVKVKTEHTKNQLIEQVMKKQGD